MRTIGPLTQASIDAQAYKQEILISVWDESDVPAEYSIPSDAATGRPIVSFSLENTSWEMTLEVHKSFILDITGELDGVTETTCALIEGRKIVATEYLASGEPLALFSGKIMRVMPALDTQGYRTGKYRLDCVGAIAAEADAHFNRFDITQTPYNPGMLEPDDRARVTGIVKKYRNTIPYTYDATATTVYGPAAETEITVAAGTGVGFDDDDLIFLLNLDGPKMYQTKIASKAVDIFTLDSDNAIDAPLQYPSGSIVFKAAALIPCNYLPYFGSGTLNDWVTVLNHAGTAMTKGTDFNVYRDRRTGQFYLRFLTDPGATYTVDVYVIDRWVLLDRRTYDGAIVAPYYYVLDGIQGQAGTERLNDQASTTVRADKTISATELWVTDPTGIFPTSYLPTPVIDVINPGGEVAPYNPFAATGWVDSGSGSLGGGWWSDVTCPTYSGDHALAWHLASAAGSGYYNIYGQGVTVTSGKGYKIRCRAYSRVAGTHLKLACLRGGTVVQASNVITMAESFQLLEMVVIATGTTLGIDFQSDAYGTNLIWWLDVVTVDEYPTPWMDRWLSTWIEGIEYRGKVFSVDKSGGANHGQIVLDPDFPLLSYAGDAELPTGGEVAGNTSSTHYEIFDTRLMPNFFDGGAAAGPSYLPEPIGGWFNLFVRIGSDGRLRNVIRGYDQDGITAIAGKGQIDMEAISYVVRPSAGSFNPDENNPLADVAKIIVDILQDILLIPSVTVETSGYCIAPATVAQGKAGEVLEQVVSSTLPPNYRIRDTENGAVVAGYIQQKAVPDIILQGGKTSTPNQKPLRATRVIVMGKQVETNRAAQLVQDTPGIQSRMRLFDGPRSTYAEAAKITATTLTPGKAIFAIPKCEPGRFPIVSKASMSFGPVVRASIGSATTPLGAVTYLPIGSAPNDGQTTFTRREVTDLSPLGSTTAPWYLVFEFLDMAQSGGSYVDEIEVYIKEGAYWEACLTSDTSKAPADGATEGDFGQTWKQPDRTLSVSNRYAAPQHMARNQCAGYHRTITIQQDGLTQSQAQTIAEATLNQSIRGFESYEWTGAYDPRVQPGDTCGLMQEDGSVVNRLVWAISKQGSSMSLTLYDYSR